MSKRKDTFKGHREGMVESRLALVKAALEHLSNAYYKNVTRLARDVASFVSLLESTENDKLPEKYRRSDLKPVSPVTILRNDEYRRLLDGFLLKSHPTDDVGQEQFIDVEALIIKNKGLEALTKLLKNKLADGRVGHEGLDGEALQISQKQVEDLFSSLELLVSVVHNMQEKTLGVFYRATADNDPKGKGPGFWGPYGLVATAEEMLELEDISRRIKEWRNNKVLK